MLSSHRVLEILENVDFRQGMRESELREAAYLTYQPWAARQPDHIFEQSWRWLRHNQPSISIEPDWAVASLGTLSSEFLEFRHGVGGIRLGKFGAWQQSVLSRISALPILAIGWAREQRPAFHHGRHAVGQEDIQSFHGMICPMDASVEEYIAREGLHETHLHLNGSTHAEVCWLRALRDPWAEVADFNKKWCSTTNPHGAKLRELVHAVNPRVTPSHLLRQLSVASQIRKWLCAEIAGLLSEETAMPASYSELESGRAPVAPEIFPGRAAVFPVSKAEELQMLMRLFLRLNVAPSPTISRMAHLYVVLQNQYYRLLVQSEDQFGFDQFQKFTYTELREPAEREYYQRFLSIHGDTPKSSTVGYLEGRFAPKKTALENYKLLAAILSGFLQYIRGARSPERSLSLPSLLNELERQEARRNSSVFRHHRLALVAHFIKLPWSESPNYKAGPYRYYALRVDIEQRTNLLVQALGKFPKLRTWLRGIDAAANELHAPPEVFASVYRICKSAGITRRTYHVGEDFTHLISGLRHMVDAIQILGLENGDRIGHGTAMGISPALWVERMPGKLVLKKGDWMTDLLVIWQILRQSPVDTNEAYRVEGLISDLAGEIFGQEVSCTTLSRAMKFRGLNLRFLMASKETSWSWATASYSDLWTAEARLVAEAQLTNPEDLTLLRRWFEDKGLWRRSEALIQVESAFFTEETYVRLQQAVMRLIRDKGIVVETLPSSNVRISQYYCFSEHHALRWMRVPGHLRKDDPEIMVSLGSDDPGIFAGDLKSEFYQLYASLRNLGLGDAQALAYLKPVNERGRQYRFHAAERG